MTYQPGTISDDLNSLPKLPDWVTSGRAETPEDVAFLSGAALAHLHLVVSREDVPQSLLRERLALRAAEACMMRSGRSERAGELRDAVAFLQPGDQPGPAGEVTLSWRHAVERPIAVKALHRALPTLAPEQIATWLDGFDPRGAGQGGPVARSAAVLETVLAEKPREEATALILADAILAQALGWNHIVPLLAVGLKRGDLRKRGEDLRLACHRAVIASTVEVTRLAADLTRSVARLHAVAPKLRAKGAGEALKLFLTRDAVAPSALTSLNSDRAARRFCGRLVELGVVRELTGRDTFRLYGL
ncbi:DUF1403 family protein [Roseovarius aestuarii]|uniref:DUF1403 family protein n=1 Tax=Roseovarius aestuarii TaxID=475083 RepID=A0A1X7BWF2_9RHOB|nr:DUF1403 family protein [Roseovarius aestuarii]SMC13820.1 hypothetical protein ROA7745_03680 [Roseovarius aestuarii]